MALQYSLVLGSVIPPTLFLFLRVAVAIWGFLCQSKILIRGLAQKAVSNVGW